MPTLVRRIPAYRRHKFSGQAVVTLNGFDHYLGEFGSEPSRRLYGRLIAEWLSGGRHLAKPTAAAPVGVTVSEVILSFWRHAKTYYDAPGGRPTSELAHFRYALRPLRRLYGELAAESFGPKKLAAVREAMVQKGWSRRHVNQQVRRIVMAFKYAAGEERISAAVHVQLKTLASLKRGRTTARETAAKKPVAPELIEAVRPFVSRQVWAMIQLQLLSGCRPGEIVRLRGVDLDRSASPWRYRLQEHKTAHHEKSKTIYFGPRAQAILRPFLDDRDGGAYLFSPAEAETERRAALHLRRRTALNAGNRPGTNRKSKPSRQPAECYREDSYRRAIGRACELAFPEPPALRRQKTAAGRRMETPDEWKARIGAEQWKALLQWRREHHWHPHQLRHNAATTVRSEFGLEMARLVLGNSSIPMAELYAEVDHEKASRVMEQLG